MSTVITGPEPGSGSSTGTLAERIRKALDNCGMSQGRLETEAKLPRGYASRILAGQRKRIGPAMLCRIAAAVGVDVRELAVGASGVDTDKSARGGCPGLAPEQARRVLDALQNLLTFRYGGNASALARDLDISQSAVSQLVSGKNAPSFATAERVAFLVDKPVTALLAEAGAGAGVDERGAERAAVVAFIRGVAAESAHREEFLKLARRIAAGEHAEDT